MVGIPTLDALALVAPSSAGRLCAVLDARKREVYAALYERTGDALTRLGEPVAIAAEALATRLGAPCAFIGDAVESYGDVFQRILGAGAVLLSSSSHPPSATTVAELAAGRLRRSEAGDDLESLEPSYLRPPEAELTQSAHSPSDAASTPTFVDKVPLVY